MLRLFENPIILTLLISLLIQIIFFVFAASFKSDKVTDLSYSLTFIIIAIYWYSNSQMTLTQLIISMMVIIWGLRLGIYLFIRILKIKKDPRFNGIRENFWAFAKFWILQGISVWIIVIPASFYLTRFETPALGFLGYVGITIWAVGLITETIADWQKFTFYDIPKEKRPHPWIDYGIWKYSRHPNYFGEMLVWWGMFVFTIPVLSGLGWLTLIGPVWISILLLFITGLPPLEKKMDEQYGDDPHYQTYKNTTHILFPLPAKSNETN